MSFNKHLLNNFLDAHMCNVLRTRCETTSEFLPFVFHLITCTWFTIIFCVGKRYVDRHMVFIDVALGSFEKLNLKDTEVVACSCCSEYSFMWVWPFKNAFTFLKSFDKICCFFLIYSSALRPLTLTAKIRTRWMKNVHLWIWWQRVSVVQCFFRRRISLFYANETGNLSKCNWRNTSNKIKSTCMNIEHAQRDRSQERHANCFMSIFVRTFYSHRCFKQFVTEKSVHIL